MTDSTDQIIILLGTKSAGKTALLLKLAGWVSPTAVGPPKPPLSVCPRQQGFCSKQQLLHSHLTVRENLQLTAALHHLNNPLRLERLLEQSGLAHYDDSRQLYNLPRLAARQLSLVTVLLPDPDVLFIDDIGEGLSLPARRQLWQWLQAEQRRRPRTIVYATRDPEVACMMAGEVWLVEDGTVTHRWPAGAIPSLPLSTAAFSFELKSAQAAQAFQAELANSKAALGISHSRLLPNGRTVELWVDQAMPRILDLILLVGRDLTNFSTLPLEIDDLPVQWAFNGRPELVDAGDNDEGGMDNIQALLARLSIVPDANGPLPSGGASPTWRQQWRACRHIAVSEWKRHFRRFWQAGNLLLSAVLLLFMLLGIAPHLDHHPASFWVYGPLPLLFAAAMSLGLATEAMGRWATTGEMDTLFEPAQPPGPDRPLSLLALSDRSPTGRTGLLAGLCLGQLLLLASHMLPIFLLWPLILVTLALGWQSWLISLVYGMLTAVTALGLAILLSFAGQRPGWGTWLGWPAWYLLTVSVVSLPPPDYPALWLWPIIGFTTAFGRAPQATGVWVPFFAGCLGCILIWWVAVWLFRRRTAVWTPE